MGLVYFLLSFFNSQVVYVAVVYFLLGADTQEGHGGKVAFGR